MTTPLREQVADLTVKLDTMARQNDNLQNMLVEERTKRINLERMVAQQQHTIERQQAEIDGLRALLAPGTGTSQQRRDSNASLVQALQESFSLAELTELADSLDVRLEAIPGSTLPEKASELVKWFERRGELPRLRDAAKRARNHLKL
jgi:predicted nucleotidyltransferase